MDKELKGDNMKTSEKFELAILIFMATILIVAPNKDHALKAAFVIFLASILGWLVSMAVESERKRK